jgi:hypothetical protein
MLMVECIWLDKISTHLLDLKNNLNNSLLLFSSGILENKSRELLRLFFKSRR